MAKVPPDTTGDKTLPTETNNGNRPEDGDQSRVSQSAIPATEDDTDGD